MGCGGTRSIPGELGWAQAWYLLSPHLEGCWEGRMWASRLNSSLGLLTKGAQLHLEHCAVERRRVGMQRIKVPRGCVPASRHGQVLAGTTPAFSSVNKRCILLLRPLQKDRYVVSELNVVLECSVTAHTSVHENCAGRMCS